MRIKWLLPLALFMGACDPIDDKSWFNNEQVSLDWTIANPATGYRPTEVTTFDVSYYPQDMATDKQRLDYACDQDLISFPIGTGQYDLLAISNADCVIKEKYFRSARIEFKTELDSMQNRKIVSGGDEMLYKGYLSNISVDEKQMHNRKVVLKRLLKKITFVVNIFDYKELTENVDVSISGVASKMLLHNGEVDADSQAILSTSIAKFGKEAESELGVHTTYKGTAYVLGVAGNNVVDISYTDSRGDSQQAQVDVSSYLKSWDTEEAVIYININSMLQESSVERWNTITGDIVINNEDV